MKVLYKGGVVLAVIAIILAIKGLHPIVCILAIKHMLEIGAHGFFGIGIFTQSSLSSHPVTDYVDIGYFNNLKLKFLYFMRYQMNDNFLWEEWHTKLSNEIVALLESRNAKKDDEQIYTIPNFNYDEITPADFYKNYVLLGRPAIIHNVPTRAMKNFSPEYIESISGNFTTDMRCGPKTLKMTVSQYLKTKSDPNATVCYLDNNANIFMEYPQLEADLEINKFSAYAMNKVTPEGQKPDKYFYSQLFLSLFPSLGVTYHCANYNNFFFMIKGRKRWTFVDSSHSFFLYPTFPRMMRNSISRISWSTLRSEKSHELIAKYYPLFRYAPKYQFTLQPGDMLFNPSWNWHQVENLDTESIGVASRWAMPAFYPYTNALFSAMHFTSYDFWTMLYNKISLKLGIIKEAPYNPWAHFQFDDNVNFGRIGTMYKYRDTYQNVMSESVWKQYLEYLEKKSVEHGVDYKSLNE